MANLNLNKVILAGRLVADPELRQTASGIFVTSCRIAISRRFVKQSDEQNSQQIDKIGGLLL